MGERVESHNRVIATGSAFAGLAVDDGHVALVLRQVLLHVLAKRLHQDERRRVVVIKRVVGHAPVKLQNKQKKRKERKMERKEERKKERKAKMNEWMKRRKERESVCVCVCARAICNGENN